MVRLFTLLVALLGGAVLAAVSWVVFVPSAPARLEVSGYEYLLAGPDQAAEIRAAVALRAAQLEASPVALHAGDHFVEIPAPALGLSIDRARAEREAREGLQADRISFSTDPRLWLWRRFSSKSESYSFELQYSLDEAQARAQLNALVPLVDREAIDAKLLIAEHKILASRPGRQLSVEASLLRLGSLAPGSSTGVEAAVDLIEPRITEEQLAPVDVTRVLSSYETSFRGKAGPRAVNIRNAARYLNGAIVLPGEVLSFNEQVGRRIYGRGFVDAPVIMNDELELDVGGGVCQVATTLHAAAVFGNLEVVRRRSHSRPSGYAPLGLDATVIDGKVDLQLRNPFDEPVLVHVFFPGTYSIRVELLGRDPDAKVEHAYSVTHREPYARRVWTREEIPLGGFEKKQKGSEGMDVVSVLRIRHDDGREISRSYRSKYYPVPEVFWLGEGATSSALPQMPEGATGLVVDGEEVQRSTGVGGSPEDVPSLEEADGSNIEAGKPASRR